MTSLKPLCTVLLALLACLAISQGITVTGGDTGTFKVTADQPVAGSYRYNAKNDKENSWLITLIETRRGDFTLTGSISGGYNLKGTLFKATGNLKGTANSERYQYNFEGKWKNGGIDITRLAHLDKMDDHGVHGPGRRVYIRLTPDYKRPYNAPKPKDKPTNKPADKPQGSFGLVSKTVGAAAPPGENNDSTVSGTITESSFDYELKMKPPYKGGVTLNHTYSHQLTSTLKPGDIIELTVISSATREANDAPYIGSSAKWVVEGAEVLGTPTAAFVGSGSDGKFYANSTGKTRFRVPKSGTIKIIATHNGSMWGSSANWAPVTYIYKFGERAKAEIGGG